MKKCVAAVCAVLLLLACVPGCAPGGSASGLAVSEVCARNRGILADDDGESADWIELYNGGEQAVDLSGYTLTDTALSVGKYRLPAVTLEPGEYLVVYASGKDRADTAARIIHTSFSLSEGETVTLYGPYGDAVSSVTVPAAVTENYSYGSANGTTVYFRHATPGRANAPTYDPDTEQPDDWQQGLVSVQSTLLINEYATSESITVEDGDGDFTAWMEIYNAGQAAVDLTGYTLTDNPARADKWTFPACSIEGGGYLVVYLSGKTAAPAGELHAAFSLSGEEDALLLYDAGGGLIDSVAVRPLTSNLSCGLTGDGAWEFFPLPTPGKANTTASFADIHSARYPANKTLTVNEIAAVNVTGVQADDWERYDYFELRNMTDAPVNLKDYLIFDGQGPDDRYTLPAVSIPAGGYLTVFCGADKNSYSSRTGEVFLTAGLSRTGNTLALASPDGVVIDVLKTGRMDDGTSAGRISDTDDAVWYFETQTPGKANPTKGVGAKAPAPVLSLPSGYVAAGTQVSISAAEGATIHYTTDGSAPTKASPVYTAPITVTANTVIRAAAALPDRLLSDDRAGTYITEQAQGALETVFLSAAPDDLFGHTRGIFAKGPGYADPYPYMGANYWRDWERAVHFEYLTKEGVRVLEFNAGIKVFGQYSRVNEQKSVSINMRDRYGAAEFCYPLFEDCEVNVFSELVLRNSGQDYNTAHLRDAFVSTAIADMEVDTQPYKPVRVYINGQYWGLYDLREKVSESYVANRFGCAEEEVDLFKGNGIVMAGSTAAWKELLTYIKAHDLSVQAHYDYVAARVDIEEVINYWITITYFGNTDTGNIKYFRAGESGKWRIVVFDQDYCLYPSTHQWNMVEEMIHPKGHGIGHMFSSVLMRGLFQNKGFKEQFLRTYGQCLRNELSSERLTALCDRMAAEIADEMALQIARWNTHGGKLSVWQNKVKTLRGIIEGRAAQLRQDIIDTFACQHGSTYGAPYKMTVAAVTALLDGKA